MRADEINRQPSKIVSEEEKGFSKDYEKDMKNPIESQKIRRTCGQAEFSSQKPSRDYSKLIPSGD